MSSNDASQKLLGVPVERIVAIQINGRWWYPLTPIIIGPRGAVAFDATLHDLTPANSMGTDEDYGRYTFRADTVQAIFEVD